MTYRREVSQWATSRLQCSLGPRASSYRFFTAARGRSPWSPCPDFTAVFAFRRRSAANDCPTSSISLNCPSRPAPQTPRVSISPRFEIPRPAIAALRPVSSNLGATVQPSSREPVVHMRCVSSAVSPLGGREVPRLRRAVLPNTPHEQVAEERARLPRVRGSVWPSASDEARARSAVSAMSRASIPAPHGDPRQPMVGHLLKPTSLPGCLPDEVSQMRLNRRMRMTKPQLLL